MGRKSITEDVVHSRVKARGYTMTRFGGCMRKKSDFECDTCGYEWTAMTNDVCSGRSGCKSCSNRVPQTTENITKWLIDNNKPFIMTEFGGNARKMSEFKCSESKCGHVWSTTTGSIKNMDSGCPKCVENATRSKAEQAAHDYLSLHGYMFSSEVRLDKIKNKLHLPFDFGIRLERDNKPFLLLLELDGLQHFKASYFGSTKNKTKAEVTKLQNSNLAKIQHNDRIKTEGIAKLQAEGKPIDLLRIRYDEDTVQVLSNYLDKFLN